jgi:hypothetical protein
MILFSNDGAEIVKTNYFDSDWAVEGYFFLTWNAGVARLVVPDSRLDLLNDLTSAEFVILSTGPWDTLSADGRRDMIELLFEDSSDAPLALHISMEQTDRALAISPDTDKATLTIWTRAGKQAEKVCRLRRAEKVPCLDPWPGM